MAYPGPRAFQVNGHLRNMYYYFLRGRASLFHRGENRLRGRKGSAQSHTAMPGLEHNCLSSFVIPSISKVRRGRRHSYKRQLWLSGSPCGLRSRPRGPARPAGCYVLLKAQICLIWPQAGPGACPGPREGRAGPSYRGWCSYGGGRGHAPRAGLGAENKTPEEQ